MMSMRTYLSAKTGKSRKEVVLIITLFIWGHGGFPLWRELLIILMDRLIEGWEILPPILHLVLTSIDVTIGILAFDAFL